MSQPDIILFLVRGFVELLWVRIVTIGIGVNLIIGIGIGANTI